MDIPTSDQISHDQRSDRVRRIRRASFSSTVTSSTAATLTSEMILEQNNSEPYAGATFEAVPSSIVSFHHPHSFQSSNFPSPRSSGNLEQRGRRLTESDPLVLSSAEQSRSSSRNPSHFRFFTQDQISNAEGASTLENTDYDTVWDAAPTYEQNMIYGTGPSSRRSSMRSFSRASSLSNAKSYRSFSRRGRSGSRVPQRLAENADNGYIYHSATHSSSSLSRYTTRERIPIELENQTDEILEDRSSTRSLESSNSRRSSSENNRGSLSGHDDVHNMHSEYLKPDYHEKFYPRYTPDLHYQRFYITEEDLVIGIAAYQTSSFWHIIYNICCFLSFGLVYLMMRWLPHLRVRFYGVKVPLGKAEWVVIENEFGEFAMQPIDRQWYNRPLSTVLPLDSSANPSYELNDVSLSHHHANEINPNVPILITFEYRYIKFIYSPLDDLFKTNNNWIDPDWVDLSKLLNGLTTGVQEDRELAFGKNQINLRMKTTSEILFNEVLHPFYVFQVFSIILWGIDEYYYYAACIFLISVLSIFDSLNEQKKVSRNLAEVSHFHCDVRVLRDKFWTTISSSELVPGDIYEVSDPNITILPCDSVLLSSDCIVNESMLTGESVPVSKFPATQETMYQLCDDFQSTQISSFVSKSFLYNGTSIIRARIAPGQNAALAMVVRTGFSTTKGSLVRSMVFPKPTGFKFYKDSFKYIGFMSLIAIFGFCISCVQFVKLGLDKKTMILRALDIITIVVPPALPATLTIGTNFALSRLKEKGIYCISPTRLNISGKIDVMCFDKTGTLTEDGLDVLGVQLSQPTGAKGQKFGELLSDIRQVFPKFSLNDCSSPLDFKSRNFFMSLLTCHSLRSVDGDLLGDPLDFKMFQFTGWSFEEDFQKQTFHSLYEERHEGDVFPENSDIIPAVVHPDGNNPENTFTDNDPHNFLGVVRSFEFLSELRRMSVIVKTNNEDLYWSFTKGAPEVVSEICNKSTLPADFEEVLRHYTHNGYRVIACAGKILPKRTWLYSQKVSREQVESNLEFLGFIIFQNKLKKETSKTLESLQDANIRTIMCTGDNILTAISVGREAGLIQCSRVYIPSINDAPLPGETVIVWRDVNEPDNILDTKTLKPVKVGNSSCVRSCESDYTLAVSGDVFRLLFRDENEIPEEYLDEILLKSSIYARMSPDEKHELMMQLQKLDYTVGFCGDGANDCGALKAADVGISLSEAEASVAAPFTSKVFNISCVPDVIREGRAALVTSFACFQYMSLYSAIQFITITILYSRGSNLGDFQFLYIDLLLIVPIAICMSWSKSYEKIARKRPSANLVSPKILVPLLISVFLVFLFQVIPWLIVQKMSWYIKPVVGGDDTVQSSDNTVLFFVSNFQYILTAIVLSVGPPYREPMSKNFEFIVDIIASICVSVLLMTLNPESYLGKKLQLTPISNNFTVFIIVWVLLNYYAQLYIPPSIKGWLKKRKSSKKYKLLIQGEDKSADV
ncbi:hypothetical protein SMKI_15G4240 [Saccharomyces mikatae IFO 1815]|uniref:Cation-transporting ATPase n=1 Tax=Saccharomyces mikatae IFO 1815 TaxID=226126 RepID=A0AA35IW69_SACMI|nr:uncharacterized protein SMKI_15G4240 [Saccharomyces mikatae IFO 1815]CAI4036576.1 hypothetical protein SMKI_15G4240 [Saccharomyces mikatae IFO 1815]